MGKTSEREVVSIKRKRKSTDLNLWCRRNPRRRGGGLRRRPEHVPQVIRHDIVLAPFQEHRKHTILVRGHKGFPRRAPRREDPARIRVPENFDSISHDGHRVPIGPAQHLIILIV